MQKFNNVYIKGMVCNRCITSVKEQLDQAGIESAHISLGLVNLPQTLSHREIELVAEKLEPLGFSIALDKKRSLVNAVKKLVEEVYSGDFDFPYQFRFSLLAATRLQKDYETISHIFSSLEDTTIEKFIIRYRISKVRDMLIYGSLTLSDISFRLGFSGVAHLSRQFKEQTGMSTTTFRLAMRQENLKNTA